jgi:hypothetical protein
METTVLENIQAGFKGSNKIPDALVKFIEWSQGNLEIIPKTSANMLSNLSRQAIWGKS